MSGWNGSMLGLKVQKKDEKLAAQFLRCIGADPDGEGIDEEIGKLDYAAFCPSVTGSLSETEDLLGIEKSVQKTYSCYQDIIRERYEESIYEDGEDDEASENDEYEEAEADSDSRLDDLSVLVGKLFDQSCVYFAHEDGNTVNDTFYRYETSLDPLKGMKTVSNCFYSFDGGPDRDHSTGNWQKPINAKPFSLIIIRKLIENAECRGYDELARKLAHIVDNACDQNDPKNDPNFKLIRESRAAAIKNKTDDETVHSQGKKADSNADTWDCACGQKGIADRFCPNCGSKKPAPIQMDTWDCACGQKGIADRFCPNCGAKRYS